VSSAGAHQERMVRAASTRSIDGRGLVEKDSLCVEGYSVFRGFVLRRDRRGPLGDAIARRSKGQQQQDGLWWWWWWWWVRCPVARLTLGGTMVGALGAGWLVHAGACGRGEDQEWSVLLGAAVSLRYGGWRAATRELREKMAGQKGIGWAGVSGYQAATTTRVRKRVQYLY
jgi:hypothetical protein